MTSNMINCTKRMDDDTDDDESMSDSQEFGALTGNIVAL